ncbi:hypothetical protein CONPUDRAFT_38669, partial [Coniophora puteana RWD-64-598 SS2]
KKMFAIFSKSDVFITACQHGFLLTICNMIHSSELMKYLLVSIKHMLNVIGDDNCFSYDIKCHFWQILMNTSLGPEAHLCYLQDVVPAFHSHAQNWYC